MSFSKAAKQLFCLLTAISIFASLPQAMAVTVTYSAGGGKPVPPKQVLEDGSRLDSTPFLERTGYTFSGWYTDSKFADVFSITSDITENTRLYAKWTKNPIVSFNVKGGKPVPEKQVVLPYEMAQMPEEPSRDGYIFLGWYKDIRYTEEYNFNEPVTKNTTVYAKWAAVPVVSFSGSGLKPAESRKVPDSNSLVTPLVPAPKNGYTFDGWYTSAKRTVKFDFSTPITKKTTLYAKWVRNPVIKFSTKGRCPAPPPQNLLPGEEVSEPSITVPDGYILEGWYSDSACKREFDFDKPVSTSATVYANIARGK